MARDILESTPSFSRRRRPGSDSRGSATSGDDGGFSSSHDINNDSVADDEDEDDPSLAALALSFILVFGSVALLCYGASRISKRLSSSMLDFALDDFGVPVPQDDNGSFSFDWQAILSLFLGSRAVQVRQSTDVRRIRFENLPTRFPDQSSRMWKTVKVVADSLKDNPLGVLTFLGRHESKEIRRRLAQTVGKTMADMALDEPCPIVELSAKDVSEERIEHVRRSFAEVLLTSPQYVAIVHDLENISSDGALMIYPFIDELRAPCKRCVFIFTMTMTGSSKANNLQSHAEEILDNAWRKMANVGSRMEVITKFTPNCIYVR